MIRWKSTTIHHEVRLRLGLTNDEYTLLDWVYHTQGSEVYGKDGWCEIPYQGIALLIGISKGGAFQMVDRMEKRGFIEVNPANTKRKRVTAKFSLPVYFDVKQDDEVGAAIVQKVNAEKPSVQKVNDERSESERNRSESERQIKVNKENIEVNNSLSPANEIESFQPQHIWGDVTEARLQKAQAALKDYFEKNSFRRREISDAAKNTCNETQFDEEVDLWLRRNADDYAITQNPVKALTSGRGNLVNWLAQSWCRAKYQTNGNENTQTSRNGGIPQQRKANTHPTTEELKRKYNLL